MKRQAKADRNRQQAVDDRGARNGEERERLLEIEEETDRVNRIDEIICLVLYSKKTHRNYTFTNPSRINSLLFQSSYRLPWVSCSSSGYSFCNICWSFQCTIND